MGGVGDADGVLFGVLSPQTPQIEPHRHPPLLGCLPPGFTSAQKYFSSAQK